MRPASIVHYDPEKTTLWVGSSWTQKATVERTKDEDPGPPPVHAPDKCYTLERYNIHGIKQPVVHCPAEVEMSAADKAEKERDDAQADADTAEAAADTLEKGTLEDEIAALEIAHDEAEKLEADIQVVLPEERAKLTAVRDEIALAQEELKNITDGYDLDIERLNGVGRAGPSAGIRIPCP